MRVLILGGGGMLGHKLWQRFQSRFDTWVAFRGPYSAYARYGLFDPARTVDNIDVADVNSIVRAIGRVRPEVIINAVGIIKQLPVAKDLMLSIATNALFPHRLAALAKIAGIRVVQVSSDCVFSGRKGNYIEEDVSDAEDLYGRTKYLGELASEETLTLRTSIIGRELSTRSGLVEWFLANRRGRVRGFTRAAYSGVTTLAFADILAEILERHPTLSGVYHLSSDRISKYDLLRLLDSAFGAGVEVEAEADTIIDRTLDSSRLRGVLNAGPPSWPEMVQALAADETPYDQWRQDARS